MKIPFCGGSESYRVKSVAVCPNDAKAPVAHDFLGDGVQFFLKLLGQHALIGREGLFGKDRPQVRAFISALVDDVQVPSQALMILFRKLGHWPEKHDDLLWFFPSQVFKVFPCRFIDEIIPFLFSMKLFEGCPGTKRPTHFPWTAEKLIDDNVHDISFLVRLKRCQNFIYHNIHYINYNCVVLCRGKSVPKSSTLNYETLSRYFF